MARAFGEMAAASPKDFLVIHPSDHPSVINELDESTVSKREQPEGTALIRMDQTDAYEQTGNLPSRFANDEALP